MVRISISPSQKELTIDNVNFYTFLETGSMSCSGCALNATNVCSKAPCSALERLDKKNGIFKPKK